MLIGKLVRLNRLFNERSRHIVTIAMDHTISYGVIPGLENIRKVVDMLTEARPDAIMMHKGIVERCFAALRAIVHDDAAPAQTADVFILTPKEKHPSK